MIRELGRVLCQRYKNCLRYVLRRVGFANHAERGGIDQVNMSKHDLGKRGFGMVLCIVAQQLLVTLIIHSRDNTRCRGNRTGNKAGEYAGARARCCACVFRFQAVTFSQMTRRESNSHCPFEWLNPPKVSND
jgi:hypothetical protein